MASPLSTQVATPRGGPDTFVPRPLWVTVMYGAATIAFGAYATWLLAGPRDYTPARELYFYCALLVVPVVSFTGRALAGGTTHNGWWAFAAGALTWLAAEAGYVVSTADTDSDPYAWVDWFYIVAPGLFYVAVILLARVMLRQAALSVWLDGVIITFALCAFATLFFPGLLENFSGSATDIFFDVTGPLTSLLLVSLLVALLGLVRGSAAAMWWLLLAGASLLWLADLLWLTELAESTYFNGSVIDLGWPAGMLLMGAAAWTRMFRRPVVLRYSWSLPVVVTLLAFGLVLHATQQPTPVVTTMFAAAAVLAGSLRSVQAFRSASARAESQRQAHSDDLTGLANRRGLNAVLDEHPASRRALLLVDIDRFKQINDSLGHQAGDEVLQQVGVRFQQALGDDPVIARIGGDEFAVLMPLESGWEQATAAARTLHEAMTAPVTATGIELQVDISIGIAFSPQHGATLSELLRTADRAMYRAKREQVGSLVFDQNWESCERGGLFLMQELRKAVDQGEFTCHFQPQLDVLTDEVVCMESLVRWQHPDRGLIPAGQFLPMLEQTAMIRPLTDQVLDRSLAQLAVWDAQGLDLRMSVNLSATNLLDRGLPLQVAQMLARYHVPAPRLTLEITETALTGDQERVRIVLGQLHEIGVQISIDDYGSGYSSLRQVGRLAAQELKLDRDFVTGVGQRGDLQSILSATVHLAHGLRLRMVAEGVESASDLDQVRNAGCDLAQGYVISPPRSAEEITEWMFARPAGEGLEVIRGARPQ